MIWLAFLIPVAVLIFCAVKFKRKMAWWEYLLQFIIPVIVVLIAKMASVSLQTKDSEQWNMHLTGARYYEYWSTWVEKECCAQTDSIGNCIRWEDCSYCDEFQPYWEAYDNCGNTYRISQARYKELVKLWDNEVFQDQGRRINKEPKSLFGGGRCGVDGDAYYTKFDGVFEHLVPVTVTHTYENKVKASTSVFNFQEVDSMDKADYGLYDYPPASKWYYMPILGDNNPKANKRLFQWNGKLGSFKQLHMLICVFRDKDIQAAYLQENYWKGGNKNEFILCIGLDSEKKIDWTKVITWCENDRLITDIESEVRNMDYDLVKIVDYMATECNKRFQRKEFADFSYIKVQPSMKAVMIALIINLIVSIGLAIFFVRNNFTFFNPTGD